MGDPVPLDTPDLRRFTMLAPTAPPWRLANRLDETRRIRLAGAWATQFRVVFDYSVFDTLAGVIGEDAVVATCHPNRGLDELSLPDDPRRPAFPVGPNDPEQQRSRLDQLLSVAAEAGAGVILLPELSVTEELAAELAVWIRRPGPVRLLVAGSFHHADPSVPSRRSNRAIAWVRGHAQPLVQDKHSPADRPVSEDITPTGWPELRVYVTADGWHLVIAVCRDLLNPQAVHALAEAGANLVLAPSMSETLVAFGGPVAQLVGTGQALVAVANNPAEWLDSDQIARQRPARALFGHPGFAHLSRQVTAPDSRPGIALLHVRGGRVSWHALDSSPIRLRTDRPTDRPAWVDDLRRHCAVPTTLPTERILLRPAAVLVLLSDGGGSPEVLLTSRASDLSHYADQFVFPGGAADPIDRDVVETALREANEEIGLDPASVEVLGMLPPFALTDSGFLVFPVLAWGPDARFLHPPNPAEVTALRRVAVGHLHPTAGRTRPLDATVGAMTTALLDILEYRTRGFARSDDQRQDLVGNSLPPVER